MAARPEDVRMTIGEHIEELRKRVLHSLYAFVVVFFGTFLLHEPVRKYALRPLNDSIDFAIEANKTRIAERRNDPAFLLPRKMIRIVDGPRLLQEKRGAN